MDRYSRPAVAYFPVLVVCAMAGATGYVVGESGRQELVRQGIANGYMVETDTGVRWREGWEFLEGPGANIPRGPARHD